MSIRFGLPILSISWLSSACLVRAWASKWRGRVGWGKAHALRKRTRCNSLYYTDEWSGCYAGALSTSRFVIPLIRCLALFPSSPDSSFFCLWASCLPCSLYVVRCAFKIKVVICSAKPKMCTGVNERLGLKWQGRKLWPLRNAWLMAEQNCIWKIVV